MKNQIVEQLIPILGQKAIDKLMAALQEISEDHIGWKKASVALLADAVAKFGPQGVAVATQILHDLVKGKTPDLEWTDLQVASDVLAQFQNTEVDHRAEALAFLRTFSEILGTILGGLLKGALCGLL